MISGIYVPGQPELQDATERKTSESNDDTHCDASLWMHNQHPSDQIPGVRREIRRYTESAILDFLQEYPNVFVIEGESSSEERIQDDSA